MTQFLIDDLITEEIRTVGITGHIRPDGDCVGGCMGLYLYLKKNYPRVQADVFLEPIPEELRIIPDTEIIRHDFSTGIGSYDLFFVLDSGTERTGGAKEHVERAKKTVNIDHHVSNPGSCDINYIRPGASSVCELMTQVLSRDKMDADIAKTIYIGIVTDTGMFHYSSTSPETMRCAASLMEFGFAHDVIVEKVELEKTYKQLLATGQMLSRSTLHFDGRCITSFIELDEMERMQYQVTDLDGVVSQMNLTGGVLCSVFAHGDRDGLTKVSLRSKEGVNVAVIAERFGGGGHVRASGCTFPCSAKEAIEQILPVVQKQLA